MEKARKAIRTFFLVRGLSLRLRGEQETALPLSNPDSFVQAGDVLDLNNSDLLAVTVTSKDGARQRRFLVVDLMQVAPSTNPMNIRYCAIKSNNESFHHENLSVSHSVSDNPD